MSKLRRYHTPGNWYFITSVTYRRLPILVESAELLKRKMQVACHRYGLALHAWVILPDHFHALIDTKNGELSAAMKSLKSSFASSWRGQRNLKAGRVWQHRFWDHIIRNESDYRVHLDYIHFNPVKHKYVTSASSWPHSSFHHFLRKGMYRPDWGQMDIDLPKESFGE